VYHATSDAEGAFSFDGVPSGTYVLHIDAGTIEPGRNYGASDHLISLDSTAKYSSLVLKHKDAGAGSCGGTGLELQLSSDKS